MDVWTMAGIAALALVICAGTVIKLYTHNKIKDLEGTFDVKGGQKAAAENDAQDEAQNEDKSD